MTLLKESWGFTGTREPPTGKQKDRAIGILLARQFMEFHQGCCVGSDEMAAETVVRKLDRPILHAHPPKDKKLLSRRAVDLSDVLWPAKEYLARDRDIVESCGVLVATPRTMEEEQRSGTWATIRMARKKRRYLIIIWPDGTITEKQT